MLNHRNAFSDLRLICHVVVKFIDSPSTGAMITTVRHVQATKNGKHLFEANDAKPPII
jgi:hypothetical protein